VAIHAECGKEGQQRLADLISSDEVACSFCKRVIDLSSKEWRSFIDEAAKLYQTIRRV
jgi:hypothetical protein